MQRAQITHDIHVSYIDTWSDHSTATSNNDPYTTVIGLHGTGYNSHAWLEPFSFTRSSKTVRFLAYNQRSYEGSSPAFNIKAEAGVDATAAYVEDLINFVDWAVQEFNLPRFDRQSGKGGIVLLGWSKGTVPLFALLATLHKFPPSPTAFTGHLSESLSLSTIHSHVRTCLLFEPPGSALARPATNDFKTQMSHVVPPNKPTPVEYAEAFAKWISGWSRQPDNSQSTIMDETTDANKPGSKAWEPECCLHGFAWRLSSRADELEQLAKVALGVNDTSSRQSRMPIGLMYGSNTVGYCLDSASVISNWWGNHTNEGNDFQTKIESTAIRQIKDQNHFAFENDPIEFVKVLKDILNELSPGAM
ncbi:hypothetical protein OIO90_005213 [Microbotryomycetes sp. JL221]|nr:hypothetical protein OIO90_005213 [Microbotryomycetes sp. JL221]